MTDQCRDFIGRLCAKYGEAVSLAEDLGIKYGFTTRRNTMFRDDSAYNRKTVDRLMELFSGVKETIGNLAGIGQSRDTVEKLLTRYEDELQKLSDRENELENGEKLAGRFVKALKRYLIKLWPLGNGSMGRIIGDYLEEAGLELTEYPAGHHLSNDELCSLEEQTIEIYREVTDVKERDYEVIEMIQPVIRVSYAEDEEGTEYKEIYGSCRFYCYSRQKA